MKWYKEKTFKFSLTATLVLMTLGCIGTSIVDRQFNPEAIYLFTPIILLLIIVTYLKRNKAN